MTYQKTSRWCLFLHTLLYIQCPGQCAAQHTAECTVQCTLSVQYTPQCMAYSPVYTHCPVQCTSQCTGVHLCTVQCTAHCIVCIPGYSWSTAGTQSSAHLDTSGVQSTGTSRCTQCSVKSGYVQCIFQWNSLMHSPGYTSVCLVYIHVQSRVQSVPVSSTFIKSCEQLLQSFLQEMAKNK